MTTRSINFNLQSAASPWVPPAGYAIPIGSDPSRIFLFSGIAQWNLAGANTSVAYDNIPMTGRFISSEVEMSNPLNGNDAGAAIIDGATGNGLCVLINNTAKTLRIFALTNGLTTGSALWTSVAVVPAVRSKARLTKDTLTNQWLVYFDGVQVLNGSSAVYTSAAYPSAVYAGCVSKFGYLQSLTAEYTPTQTIDSLTTPLKAGTAFSGTSTGFTEGAATLSSNGLSVAVTIGPGAIGAFSGTWPLPVDAQPYPTLPKLAQTITMTQGANTATISDDLNFSDTYAFVNFVIPVTDDNTYIGYYLNQDGFTVAGGQFAYIPYSDAVVYDDTQVIVTGAGQLVGYFIPATGTGAGNAYYYTFNVQDGGAIISGNRLTEPGLTRAGLTSAGLTRSGL